jgi:hypothetical protein
MPGINKISRRTATHRVALTALLPMLCLATGSSLAVNRCTDAKGKVTYQDTACEQSAAKTSAVDTSEAFSTKPSGKVAGVNRPARQAIDTTTPDKRSDLSNADFATARGAWRGPLQFQVTVDGKRDGAAQAITPAVIDIAPDGEVKGVITNAECQISGLATQFVTPRSASLDVSLKNCKDARFNARYSGYLNANAGAREATLSLNSVSGSIPFGKIRHASLQAVLKR